MHFSADISLGQLIVFFTLLGAIWKVNRVLTIFSIEHEILIEDLAERKGISVWDFPTRTRRRRPKND